MLQTNSKTEPFCWPLYVRESRLTVSGSENMERAVDALGKEGRGKNLRLVVKQS